MGHGHAHGKPDHNRSFAIGVGLNLAFVAVETVFGLRAHSLALVADAGHNLSDVLGLLLAWGAATLAARRPSPRSPTPSCFSSRWGRSPGKPCFGCGHLSPLPPVSSSSSR